MERDHSRLIRIALFVGMMLLAAGQYRIGGPYERSLLLTMGVNIILAVSLNLVNGFTGQFSMGHAGFMAIGAYTAAFITFTASHGTIANSTGDQIPISANYKEWIHLFQVDTWGGNSLFFVSTLLGGLAAALAGWLVGLPSLRLRGDYLAIVTLGFGEIIRVSIQNIDMIGGPRGLSGIPTHASYYTKPGFLWIYAWVGVTLIVIYRLTRSSIGRAMLAVREDEIAARAMGVDTTRYKVQAFVISSFFAGIAGALAAHYLNVITPNGFTYVRSFDVITMVVLGGMGSISGSVIAAVILSVLPEALRPIREYTGLDLRMVIYSLTLIVLMLTRPHGIFGSREIWELIWPFKTRGKPPAPAP